MTGAVLHDAAVQPVPAGAEHPARPGRRVGAGEHRVLHSARTVTVGAARLRDRVDEARLAPIAIDASG